MGSMMNRKEVLGQLKRKLKRKLIPAEAMEESEIEIARYIDGLQKEVGFTLDTPLKTFIEARR